jgi:hypothetical protein
MPRCISGWRKKSYSLPAYARMKTVPSAPERRLIALACGGRDAAAGLSWAGSRGEAGGVRQPGEPRHADVIERAAALQSTCSTAWTRRQPRATSPARVPRYVRPELGSGCRASRRSSSPPCALRARGLVAKVRADRSVDVQGYPAFSVKPPGERPRVLGDRLRGADRRGQRAGLRPRPAQPPPERCRPPSAARDNFARDLQPASTG